MECVKRAREKGRGTVWGEGVIVDVESVTIGETIV